VERIDYKELKKDMKLLCHDCGKKVPLRPGYDGIPISAESRHKMFYDRNVGWFTCCKATQEVLQRHGGKSILYHACRYEC